MHWRKKLMRLIHYGTKKERKKTGDAFEKLRCIWFSMAQKRERGKKGDAFDTLCKNNAFALHFWKRRHSAVVGR